MPSDASKMYGKNVLSFLKLILKDGQIVLNFEDDIVKETCITHNGEIMNTKMSSVMAQPAVK